MANPSFDIVSSKNTATVTPKGNVRIDYSKNNSNNVNSVYTYSNQTQITGADNERQAALYMNDKCYEVLADIVGSDMVLEQKDLDRIDAVAQKYKGSVQITKKLDEGEVTIDFKNGHSMTIDFETEAEKPADTRSDAEKFANVARAGLSKAGSAVWNFVANTVDKALDRTEQWLRTP